MPKSGKRLYEFGRFRLDPTERQLLRAGEIVPLTAKTFEVLLILVERGGHLVEKSEMIEQVWADAYVEEVNLARHVWMARKALGDDQNGDRYIETVPKRGYRFVAPVSEVSDRSSGTIARGVREKESDGNAELEAEQATYHSATREIVTAAGAEEGDATLGGASSVREADGRKSKWAWLRQRPVMIVIGMMLIGVAFGSYRMTRRGSGGQEPGARSLAVLPFTPLGEEKHDDYLGLGMTDVLITRLSSLRQVAVRPTSAVIRYTDQKQDVMKAGQELGVDAVLEGSIQRAGERLRVTVRLISIRDGRPMWAEQFDERFTDIFAVQDAISEQVASALALRLSGEERRQLAKRYTENAEAYQLYLKGRYFWNKRTEEATKKSIGYFEQAVAIDPRYALAYSGLADAYWILAFFDAMAGAEQLLPQARAAALQALALDDTLAEAHTSLGAVKELYGLDFMGAEREYKRALELNPNYATAHHRYGVFLGRMGRIDEAHAAFRRALELDPLLLLINADAGMPFYRSRKFDQAVEQYRKTIEMDPHFPRARRLLAHCYTQMGKYEEAIVEVQQAIALSAPAQRAGGRPLVDNQLAYIYAKAGRVREARRMLDELERPPNQRFIKPYFHALAYAALGNREQTFAWLEKVYEVRSHDVLSLRGDPAWDDLRGDPRFQDLVRRAGLAQ